MVLKQSTCDAWIKRTLALRGLGFSEESKLRRSDGQSNLLYLYIYSLLLSSKMNMNKHHITASSEQTPSETPNKQHSLIRLLLRRFGFFRSAGVSNGCGQLFFFKSRRSTITVRMRFDRSSGAKISDRSDRGDRGAQQKEAACNMCVHIMFILNPGGS